MTAAPTDVLFLTLDLHVTLVVCALPQRAAFAALGKTLSRHFDQTPWIPPSSCCIDVSRFFILRVALQLQGLGFCLESETSAVVESSAGLRRQDFCCPQSPGQHHMPDMANSASTQYVDAIRSPHPTGPLVLSLGFATANYQLHQRLTPAPQGLQPSATKRRTARAPSYLAIRAPQHSSVGHAYLQTSNVRPFYRFIYLNFI